MAGGNGTGPMGMGPMSGSDNAAQRLALEAQAQILESRLKRIRTYLDSRNNG